MTKSWETKRPYKIVRYIEDHTRKTKNVYLIDINESDKISAIALKLDYDKEYDYKDSDMLNISIVDIHGKKDQEFYMNGERISAATSMAFYFYMRKLLGNVLAPFSGTVFGESGSLIPDIDGKPDTATLIGVKILTFLELTSAVMFGVFILKITGVL